MVSSLNGREMLGSDILVEALYREGVRTIFAYPGGASMPIHQSLTRYEGKIRTLLPRQEQGGGFACEGLSRTTDQIGVCIATSGPGATNFTTCLADAKMDSVPIIAITGQVGTAVIGTDAFQETPMAEISRPITKHHYLVTRTEDIARVVREAFHIARTGRPGPVLIDIPKDIQNRKVVPDFDAEMKIPGYRPNKPGPTASDISQIIDLIRNSKRAVIYAGGGVISGKASPELREFVAKTGIPVAMTLQGLGSYPAEDRLSLGMLGMHGTVYSNYAVDEADLLLAFGVRFDDRVTGKVAEFCKHGKIVHIDIDPSELNKNKYAHIAVESDVKHAIAALNKQLTDADRPKLESWVNKIDQWKRDEPLKYPHSDEIIMPQHAVRRLWQIVKERGMLDNTIVTTGVGQHQMWAAQYWQFNQPNLWVTSGGLGSMGFGFPSAMGCQAGNPDKLVIDIDGDGSFLMNIQELACAYTEKLPVKTLLLNNQHLGMVAQWEDRFYESNRAQTYLGAGPKHKSYPDFVGIAKAFGLGASQITDPKDLDAALNEMIDYPGAYILDILSPFQEHVLPMIPSGMTVRDMIKA